MSEKERNDANTGKTEGKPGTGKRILLVTFGCQMNERDSEIISGLLIKEGYKLVADDKEADIVIFNTCSVREHAEVKVWSGVGRLLKTRKDGPKPIIGIAGCMAQNYKAGIFERAKGVDFVVGPSDIHKLPEIIKSVSSQAKGLFEMKVWETDGTMRPEEVYHVGLRNNKEHAFVVISEGCSNHCSYCVVPFVRGELHNRSHNDILSEIQEAIGRGAVSITLLGQNVNAFRSKDNDDINFIELLEAVNAIDGLKKFGFMTSHPKDTSAKLFKAMAGLKKLERSLHLPVQSGSDKILGLMNRGYTAGHYLSLAEEYKKYIPEGLLSTDIVVGFSGESENDFNETFNLMKKVEFSSAYIFKYSPRPNTNACGMVDDVPQKEKERRHKILLDFQRTLHKHKSLIVPAAAALIFIALSAAPSYAMLDIFDHPKDVERKNSSERYESRRSPLDYPNDCFLKQDYKETLASCQKLLNYRPADEYKPRVLYLMGLSLIKLERYPEARSYFNDIILMKPRKDDLKTDAYLGIGDSYYLEENYNCAFDSYNQALEMGSAAAPDNSRISGIYYRFFQTLTKLRKPDEAKDYLNKLEKEFPLSFEARMAARLNDAVGQATREGSNESCELAPADAAQKETAYSVQTGCFNEKKNADELFNDLTRQGFEPFIYESKSGDGPKFRVKVGRFSSSNEAQALEVQLKKAGFSTKICP